MWLIVSLALIAVVPFSGNASDKSSNLASFCASQLGNVYLEPKFSEAALSDSQDRKDSRDFPGHEGNPQRYLRSLARQLSPVGKKLVYQIHEFIRAGRLNAPRADQPLSDNELSRLLIQTERGLESSPSELFDVTTTASVKRAIREEIEAFEHAKQMAALFAMDSSKPEQKISEILQVETQQHEERMAELRNLLPIPIAELISNAGKAELSTVYDLLRDIFSQRHPVFGDVRPDPGFPRLTQQQQMNAQKRFWHDLEGYADAAEFSTTIDGLTKILNPAPARLVSRMDKAELMEMRGEYARVAHSLPVFEGVTYWGTNESGDVIANLVPGSIVDPKPSYVDLNIFPSTPFYNKAVANLLAKANWPHLVLYKINGRHGRMTTTAFDTNIFPDVIFLPGIKFRVDSHEYWEGVHYVELTEVTSSIALQPKEDELKVRLRRSLAKDERPTQIRDLSGHTWSIWYDLEPSFQKSFSAYAWRTVFMALGISSVEAYRFALDDKTMVYIEEALDLPRLDGIPANYPTKWLAPSYFALVSALLGDPEISPQSISVYDRGGGRWVAKNFWDRKPFMESLATPQVKPLDNVASDPVWAPFFEKHETIFFLGDQIGLVDPLSGIHPSIKNQLRKIAPDQTEIIDTHLRMLERRLDAAESFIRENYFYRRTQKRGRSGMVPI